MTTAYSTADTSPRDAGGAKFLAPINVATSQSDFALLAGIGASTIGATSKIHAGLQVGTHVAGSQINNNAPLGVLPVLAFTSNSSSMAINNAIPWRGDQFGAAYITGLSTTTCAMSGSTETFSTASGTLYRICAAGCGVVAAGQVAILNGGTSIAHLVFSGANETLPILDLGIHGTCFGSLRYERRNTVGTVYISANYNSTFSQG